MDYVSLCGIIPRENFHQISQVIAQIWPLPLSCRGKVSIEVLQKGSIGDGVAQLQKALYAIGLNPNEFDGYFGSGTESAVKAFQEATKLTPNGIVDNETWDYILKTTWTDTHEPVTLYRNPKNPYQRHLLSDVGEDKSQDVNK